MWFQLHRSNKIWFQYLLNVCTDCHVSHVNTLLVLSGLSPKSHPISRRRWCPLSFSLKALQIGPVDLITTFFCHLSFKFTKVPHVKLWQFVFMAGGITARFQKERSFQCITGGQQKDLTWTLIHSGAKRRFSWTRMPLQNNMVLECIFKSKESLSFYQYHNFVIVFLM